MIKIWVLVIFFSTPQLETVRHMAELTYGENDCLIKKELKSVWVEEWASSQNIQIFSYDLHCIETKMFDPNGKNT